MTIELRVHALLRQGLSDREIERATGFGRKRVARLRREAGLPAWSPPMPEHGTLARGQRGCSCGPCLEAMAVYKAQEYARSGRRTGDGTMGEEARARTLARRHADMNRTRAAATRTGARWTQDELSLALDYAYSATQVADRLGRSKAAVEHIRKKYIAGQPSGPLPRGRRATRS